MSTVQEVYNSLFAGKRLSLALADRKAYEVLRVGLSRHHQRAKLLLELTDDSLCGTYNAAKGIGTFWIGKPRNSTSFTIIEESE